MKPFVSAGIACALLLPALGAAQNAAAPAAPPAPPIPPVEPAPPPGQPWEQNPPSAEGQTPAFPQQFRAPYRPSQVKFEVQTFAAGLDNPWGLAFLPDGRMLVTERPGRIRIVDRDGKLSQPVSGVPEIKVQSVTGMMDVAIDPKFRKNGLIYFTFRESRGGDASSTSVARARLVDGPQPRLEDLQVIYRQAPDVVSKFSNYGGRMAFARNGTLFVTLGDRDQLEHRPLIQALDNGMGKVVRIRTDGSPAPGAPFAGQPGARPEIWALGFRNPIGIAVRPGSDDLWVVDVGARGGDELDLVRRGGNYGWPVAGYGKEYTGQRIGEGTAKDGYEQPHYYWDPVISPSSVMVYRGKAFAPWKNSLFVTSLSKRHLARLELDRNGRVVSEERFLGELRERLRHVVEGPDGAIYVLTDNPQGRILRLVPSN